MCVWVGDADTVFQGHVSCELFRSSWLRAWGAESDLDLAIPREGMSSHSVQ